MAGERGCAEMNRFVRLTTFCCIVMMQIAISASASGEGTVIYIQEDTGSVLRSLLHQLITEGWRDAVCVGAAIFCTCTMIIMGINHKKPRK